MEINATNGYRFQIDEDDYDLVKETAWRGWRTKRYVYIRRAYREKSKKIVELLARTIMCAGKKQVVDHINGDTLDNRKANLRICTVRQNICNARLSKNNTSGFTGVSWSKRRAKWQAYIKSSRKRIHLGYFSTKEEAALAYNWAARELFGEFARLNEIRREP